MQIGLLWGTPPKACGPVIFLSHVVMVQLAERGFSAL